MPTVLCRVLRGIATMLALATCAHPDVEVGQGPDLGAYLDEHYVLVKAGSFVMGSPPDEIGRDFDREEQHLVTVTRDYWVQKHEVTHREWKALLGDLHVHFPDCGEDCPVESVSWFGAIAYANALSRHMGLEECYRVRGEYGTLGGGCQEWTAGYYCLGDFRYDDVDFLGLDCEGFRLPTEAEWEYAARAGTQTITYAENIEVLGDCVVNELDKFVVYCSVGRLRGPAPVGTKLPNGWGLYDMLGNVFEWCWDTGSNPDSEPLVDPLSPDLSRSGSATRINRGGDWSNRADEMRCAHRRAHDPRTRSDDTGLRLVRTASRSRPTTEIRGATARENARSVLAIEHETASRRAGMRFEEGSDFPRRRGNVTPHKGNQVLTKKRAQGRPETAAGYGRHAPRRSLRQPSSDSVEDDTKRSTGADPVAPLERTPRIDFSRELLDWVKIPAGTFVMGSPDTEEGRDSDESPRHEVTVPAFEMARTEVTVAQYRACVKTGACEPPPRDFRCTWELEDADDLPIVCVTIDRARAFCRWVGGRLPSEAEWEYAARAGSDGPRYGAVDDIAWWRENGERLHHRVGLKPSVPT